jgi:hypothetical protein
VAQAACSRGSQSQQFGVSPSLETWEKFEKAYSLGEDKNEVEQIEQYVVADVEDIMEGLYSTNFLRSTGSLARMNSKTFSAEARASFATDSLVSCPRNR